MEKSFGSLGQETVGEKHVRKIDGLGTEAMCNPISVRTPYFSGLLQHFISWDS